MFDRLQRSWTLAGECYRLLKADRSLMLFPLLSAVAMAVIVASFALPLAPLVAVFARQRQVHTLSGLSWVALFAFYWVQFGVVIFFQTALIEVAMRRFDKQPATLRDGLTRATARLPIILGYALIAASVGLVLRVIAERVGFMVTGEHPNPDAEITGA
jgi:mannose/fructose/N-acetylgalactosamine-specific phosphotransferase system component IIC